MNLRKRMRNQGEVHTGALNDILFILLLFFLIVSTLANPNVIKVSAPRGKSDTNKAKQTVVVSIDKNNQMYIGQKKIQLETLEEELKAVLSREADKPSVVVNADTAGHWGDVYKVLQTAKKLGASAVASVNAN